MRTAIRTVLACTLLVAIPAFAAGTVVLRDDFSNASSGWPDNGADASRAKGFATYTPSGKYQMTPTQDSTYGVILAPVQPRSDDVRVDAEMFMYAGLGKGAAGLVCRFQDHDNFYGFIATGAPGWVLLKVRNGKGTNLAQGALPAGAMPGAVDTRIGAECEGDTLTLSIGGRQVGQARDTAFARGKSGLVVMAEHAAGTSATFDNVVLTGLGE